MGKAAHVGVGRLLRVGGLDGVQGARLYENALASTEKAVELRQNCSFNWS